MLATICASASITQLTQSSLTLKSLELPYLNSVKNIFLATQLLTELKISTVGFENVGMGDETTSKKKRIFDSLEILSFVNWWWG